jgi:hypothetical protein
MIRYMMMMVLVALWAAQVRAQSPVPSSQVEQQQVTDTPITAQDGPDAVASDEAKQVNPQARPPRHGRKFSISVAPLIVAAAFLVIVMIVVPD